MSQKPRRKAHIYKSKLVPDRYVCRGQGTLGTGPTPEDAYEEWFKNGGLGPPTRWPRRRSQPLTPVTAASPESTKP